MPSLSSSRCSPRATAAPLAIRSGRLNRPAGRAAASGRARRSAAAGPSRAGRASETTTISNRSYRVFCEAAEAGLERRRRVRRAGRDDDRDQRRSGDLAADPERARRRAGQHLGVFAGAPHVVSSARRAGVERPRLGVERARRRLRQLAPVVEHPRDVVDAGRSAPSPAAAGRSPARLRSRCGSRRRVDQSPPHHHQVAGVHAR